MTKYSVLVGRDCPPEALETLRRLTYTDELIVLEPDPLVDSPVGTHPDTILCVFNKTLYCHAEYAAANKAVLSHLCSTCGLDICTDSGERSKTYPYDCAYNALVIRKDGKDIAVGNRKSLCKKLACLCSANTKQGYAACSALAVHGTVVTADASIIKAADSIGVDTFRIRGGDIVLRGYDTGFIGGATGFCDNTVFTVGNANTCESGRQLAEFCRKHSVQLVSLCDGPLTDVGGIKFIPQR